MKPLVSESLAYVATITLENGIVFHSKVIGLSYFTVPKVRPAKKGSC